MRQLKLEQERALGNLVPRSHSVGDLGTKLGSGLDSGRGNEVRKGRDSSLASCFLLPLPSQLKRSVEREIYWGGGRGWLFAGYKYFELKCDMVEVTIGLATDKSLSRYQAHFQSIAFRTVLLCCLY